MVATLAQTVEQTRDKAIRAAREQFSRSGATDLVHLTISANMGDTTYRLDPLAWARGFKADMDRAFPDASCRQEKGIATLSIKPERVADVQKYISRSYRLQPNLHFTTRTNVVATRRWGFVTFTPPKPVLSC